MSWCIFSSNFQKKIWTNFPKKYMDKFPKKIWTNFQKNILTNFQKIILTNKGGSSLAEVWCGAGQLAPHWLMSKVGSSSSSVTFLGRQ